MFKLLPAFLLFFLVNISVFSQRINEGTSVSVLNTGYQIGGIPDTIFIFDAGITGNYFEAISDDPTATITWDYYDPASGTYVFLTSTENAVSRMNITQNRGYRVQILGSSSNFEARYWTFLDDFSVEITNAFMDEVDGQIIKTVPKEKKWCHLIRNIRSRIDSSENITYYNPATGQPITLEISYPEQNIRWTANPEMDERDINKFVRNDEYFLDIDIEDPSWEDTWYSVSVTNNLGVERKDSIFYVSIEPHANFSKRYIGLNEEYFYPGKSELYYDKFYPDTTLKSAPAKFLFTNLAENADTVIWIYGDDWVEYSHADTVIHEYILPGTYRPRQVVYNILDHLYEVCTDTFPKYTELEDILPVTVSESKLGIAQMPNVIWFPSDDNYYFRFLNDVSITDFEIAIFNRFGKRVYHFEGNIRDWEGWDGSDNNSSKYVNTGIYYYVVKEIRNLPDFETNLERRITLSGGTSGQDPGGDGDQGTGTDGKSNSLFKGFIHVYNFEQ